ncbi:hypothetical protein M758_UG219600 [Ceratodon purpureus]|nr:hypothetical protein M758_UG219600 [Ceratodon purpureus]
MQSSCLGCLQRALRHWHHQEHYRHTTTALTIFKHVGAKCRFSMQDLVLHGVDTWYCTEGRNAVRRD